MNQANLMEMRKWIDTMEETVKAQNRANAERRAKKSGTGTERIRRKAYARRRKQS